MRTVGRIHPAPTDRIPCSVRETLRERPRQPVDHPEIGREAVSVLWTGPRAQHEHAIRGHRSGRIDDEGFLYIVDQWGVVYKVDVRSGDLARIVWRMDPGQEKLPLSNRGAHNQSIEPSSPTSAAVCVSPIMAYCSMREVIPGRRLPRSRRP